MPKINRETYDKATIDISDNDNLNSFVLAIKIIEDVANEIQPYMVYENFNEISVAIGEYIGIEVYTEKILITENGDTVEHKVSDLSEDMKKVFENINFTDWRMYGIADFNYAKHTFLKNFLIMKFIGIMCISTQSMIRFYDRVFQKSRKNIPWRKYIKLPITLMSKYQVKEKLRIIYFNTSINVL